MPTIALVDDDRNILTSVSIALEAEGYRIMTYTDGASALDGFKTSPPDLAILDIKMPRMDGMELLQRLRQQSACPVILHHLESLVIATRRHTSGTSLTQIGDEDRKDSAAARTLSLRRSAAEPPKPSHPDGAPAVPRRSRPRRTLRAAPP